MYSRNPAECDYTPDTPLTRRANEIAAVAHDTTGALYGRTDYIQHPRMVAELLKVAGYGEVPQAVGLLHDTIEDTPETEDSLLFRLLEEIETLEIPEERLFIANSIIVVRAVDALSNRSGDSRQEKIKRVAANPLAGVVKSQGDAESHLEYNRWKLEEGIRRINSVLPRLRRYTRVQQELEDVQMTPAEMEDYLEAQRAKLGWTATI
ncbi:MAG TPA: hypothetical protein VFX86_00895 [Candidatus Saccharimonadales bacterium]|nr:hypothetical protein [Candidatus Saccharimonadales bacterium]